MRERGATGVMQGMRSMLRGITPGQRAEVAGNGEARCAF